MKKFFLTSSIFFLIATPIVAAAYTLQVEYPAISSAQPTTGLVDYIRYIYLFALGAVGLVAFGVLVYGGILYMMSGANPSLQGDAKAWFKAAASGLLLALASYLILNTINPNLVQIKAPTLPATQLPTGITTLQLGDSCVPNSSPLCNYGLECKNNKCILAQPLPQAGQTCDVISNPCAQGLKCENNKCVVYTLSEGESCQEGQFPRCADGLTCLNGVCGKLQKTVCNYINPQGRNCDGYYKETGWTTHTLDSAITQWCNPEPSTKRPGMVCCCKENTP